jgi:hypothetical protein
MLPQFRPGLVGILATVDPGGPHAIPVSALARLGDDALLLALAHGRGSLARLRADRRVALALVEEGFSMTAHGPARVVADPLPGAEFMAAVRLDVERLEDTRRARTLIDAGIRWRWADEGSAERDARVRAALTALAADPRYWR